MKVYLEANFYDNERLWEKEDGGEPTIFPDDYDTSILPSTARVEGKEEKKAVLK